MRSIYSAPLFALLFISCSSPRSSVEDTPPLLEVGARAEKVMASLQRTIPLDLAPVRKASFPERATRGLRVGQGDAWIEVLPRGARDVKQTILGGASVYLDALEDTDLVYAETKSAVLEDLRVARTLAAAAHPSWELGLGPAIARIEVHEGRVQAFDRRGDVRISSEPAYAVDANGVKRPITFALRGSSLEGTLDTDGLVAPITIDPAWTALASLSAPRFRAGAVRLASGKVLAVGGGSPSPLTTAEIYDPVANTWTLTKGSMAYSHENIVVTAFAGGTKVMASGGAEGSGTNIAEIYDSATDTFTQSTMPVPSRDHTQTVLADGKVALIGGDSNVPGGGSGFNNAIRIYDPSKGTWTSVIPSGFTTAVKEHAALLLPSGSILITGGRMSGGPGGPIRISDSTMIWDPVTNVLTRKTNLPTGRADHAMVLLGAGPSAGKVMVFAGQIRSGDDLSSVSSAGAALYDLAADTWTIGPFLHTARAFFGWSSLNGGRILVTGGVSDLTSAVILPFDDAELYDPTANAWLPAGKMSTARGAQMQVTLASGTEVLIAGGVASVKEGFFSGPVTSEKFSLQANGNACDAGGECTSGFCVDGVCCDTACDGQCAACDVAAKVGTCSPVAGAPHGSRVACDPTKSGDVCASSCDGTDTAACHFPATTVACGINGCAAGVETHASTCNGAGKCGDAPKSCGDFVCDTMACKTSCATKADCVNPSHFCEAGKCIPQQPNGVACTRDEACATGNCVDGTCCESKCDGQCQACDVPGQAGKCVAVAGKPHGKRAACATDTNACGSKICDGSNTASCAGTPACGTYGCDKETLVCKSSCATNADCATGHECKDAACVPSTSKCSADLSQLISTDGTKADCAPYICRDGSCLPSCKSSSDCQGGFICDGTQQCVAPAGGDSGSSGGCAYGGTRPTSAFAVVLALLGLASRRRSTRL
ncbi:MAG: hypothetical protein ACXVEE_03130 [Polyangiales bacterium]